MESPLPRLIESITIDGPAGALEGLLERPEKGLPHELCLVCHPHPLYGGTMHNKVVYRVARALRRSGAMVLRFNFRGVGRSHGVYGQGDGETEDARAAFEWLRSQAPDLPYSLAGFSFGSRIVLHLGCELKSAARLIAVGFPTGGESPAILNDCRVPKIFLQSTHDQYGPRAELESEFAKFAGPKKLIWIEARDHFFAGALDELEAAVFGLKQNETRRC